MGGGRVIRGNTGRSNTYLFTVRFCWIKKPWGKVLITWCYHFYQPLIPSYFSSVCKHAGLFLRVFRALRSLWGLNVNHASFKESFQRSLFCVGSNDWTTVTVTQFYYLDNKAEWGTVAILLKNRAISCNLFCSLLKYENN